MTDQMTFESRREILARELYVRRYANRAGEHVAESARRVRESWYRKLNHERRDRWRTEADRLLDSLAESGLVIAWTAPAPVEEPTDG